MLIMNVHNRNGNLIHKHDVKFEMIILYFAFIYYLRVKIYATVTAILELISIVFTK